MFCSACGSGDNLVVDSRPGRGMIRRRRSCTTCGHRWSTIEIDVGALREHGTKVRAERQRYDVPPHLIADWRLYMRKGYTADQTAKLLGLSKVSN